MYDLVKLQLPIKSEFVSYITCSKGNYTGGEVDLKLFAQYGVRLSAGSISINEFGETMAERLHHPYESLASSNSSLAFKIYQGGANYFPFIELKASPAKLLQGHNVYGSTDVRMCFTAPLLAFIKNYPDIFHDLVDHHNIEVAGFDVNKMARVENRFQVINVISAIGKVSTGQIKPSHSFDTSCMFNAGSKNSVLKVYAKESEVEKQIKDIANKAKKTKEPYLQMQLKALQQQSVLEMAKNAIRFEVSKHKLWLKKRAIPTQLSKFLDYVEAFNNKAQENDTHSFDETVWLDSFNPIFKAFEGTNVNTFNDEEVLKALKAKYVTISQKTGKPNFNKSMRVFRFFKAIKSEGFSVVKETTAASTFYDNLSLLTKVVPKAQLQNFESEEQSNVVPLVRMINVDFAKQLPENWEEPTYVYNQLMSA